MSTLRLKHVAFIDVALIASGFLLRVLAGAAAIAVPSSRWLLLCTALLALFLGFGKRAHELAWAERNGRTTQTRAALAGYRLDVLRTTLPGKIVSAHDNKKRWKDIYTAGHGVGNIDDIPTATELCRRLIAQYHEAKGFLAHAAM